MTLDDKSITEVSKEVSIDTFEQENKILKRALELACEDLQFFDYGIETKEQGIEMKKNYFIEQAKESLKNEKTEN